MAVLPQWDGMGLIWAPCRFVWSLTTSKTPVYQSTRPRYRRLQRVERQMPEPGHPQIRDGDEVGGCPESPGRPLGLLQQAVHGLHIRVAATVQHPAHHGVPSLAQGLGQFSERLQAAAPRPAQPVLQCLAGMLPVSMPIPIPQASSASQNTAPWICGQLGVPRCPQAPPGSTTRDSRSQVPHGMTRSRCDPHAVPRQV